MNKNEVLVIGLMSGTSLDGVDLVYVKFVKNNYREFEILNCETISYSDNWKSVLQQAIYFEQGDLDRLNVKYGVLLSKLINNFIDKFQIENIDFVASHGHTVLHQPEKGITLQIGDGQTIANLINQKVVCDFRTQDVKLGGQGAPLVPIGDELLFSEFDYCLNLGGFANISYQKGGERIAFDICPVNIVLNKYALKLGVEYDDKGKIASSGKLLGGLLNELNDISFYKKWSPKSLGLEWVEKEIFPLLESKKNSVKDVLRTFVEHISIQIVGQISKGSKVLVTGGGVYNDYLISKLVERSSVVFVFPDKKIIEFKEALIFAFLGVLRFDNQVNCMKSVTGAIKDHSSGEIFYPLSK